MTTFLSMIARRIRQPLPISTRFMMTAPSIWQKLWMRTLRPIIEARTTLPLMMVPSATIESRAIPRLPVLFGVIADLCPRWNDHIFVDDRPPNPAASSDLHQVHDDRAIDLAKAVDANVTPDNRGPDHAPADDGPFGHDRVKGHPSPPLLIKYKLRGRISVADGPNRPVPVVEIEGGVDGAQVHVRLVVGFDRSHIPPVALLFPFQGCWDPVCPEVVGVYPLP